MVTHRQEVSLRSLGLWVLLLAAVMPWVGSPCSAFSAIPHASLLDRRLQQSSNPCTTFVSRLSIHSALRDTGVQGSGMSCSTSGMLSFTFVQSLFPRGTSPLVWTDAVIGRKMRLRGNKRRALVCMTGSGQEPSTEQSNPQSYESSPRGIEKESNSQSRPSRRESSTADWCTSTVTRCCSILDIEVGGWEAREIQDKGYRGAVAMRDIEANSLVCRVPAGSAWEDDASAKMIPSTFITAKFWKSKGAVGGGAREGFVRLAVRLLYEKRIGAKSKWVSYVDSLPQSHFSLATHWDDRELEALQWPPLLLQIAGERAWIKEMHVQLQRYIGKNHQTVSFEEFRWCIDTVRSRTFSVQGKLVMCPIGDMFNHDSDERGSSFTYNEEHKSYELHVGQKVPCGDEVLIRYGSLNNNDLLAFYGFVQLGNVWDSISVAGSALEEYASHSKKEEEWVLRQAEVLEALRSYKYIPKGDVPIRLFKSGACTEALKLCSALSLESNDLPTHSARALAVQIGEGVLISEEISKRASRLLGGFCLGQLAAFPTLLAEDEEELERVEGGGMRKSRLADSLRFRITKKRILKAFVHAGSDGGN